MFLLPLQNEVNLDKTTDPPDGSYKIIELLGLNTLHVTPFL